MGNRIGRWFLGYLILHLSGKYVERFINDVIRDGVELWDIRLLPNHFFQLRIGIHDFFRLKPHLRKTKTRIHGIRRIGFPFMLRKMLKRKGFLFGFFLFIVMMYMLTSVVWRVEVFGTERIPKDEVYHYAEKIGIKPWTFKWKLSNLGGLEKQLKEGIPEAAWVGLRIEGVVVKITVVEKVKAEENLLVNPRHLVAKKSAVITDMLVEKGNPVVTRNQFVHKGELLVSGFLGSSGEEGKQKAVSAKGSVWGEVWYDSTITIPLTQEVPLYTGERKKSYFLVVGDLWIKVWGFGKETEKSYDIEESRHHLYFRSKKLPFGWEVEEKRAYKPTLLKRTKEEAIRLGLQLARKDLLIKAGEGSKIKEEKVLQQWVEHDKVYLKVHYAVIENIVEEQPITANPNS
ncbi:MAG: sporulation protein YqfD [Thermicanus sp.]|nr:sporulation protein YqfD [Thermicanus sp.]